MKANPSDAECILYEKCTPVDLPSNMANDKWHTFKIYVLDKAYLAEKRGQTPNPQPSQASPTADSQRIADLTQEVAKLKKLLEIAKKSDQLHQLALGSDVLDVEINLLNKEIMQLELKEKLKYLKQNATNLVMVLWRAKLTITAIVLKNIIYLVKTKWRKFNCYKHFEF